MTYLQYAWRNKSAKRTAYIPERWEFIEMMEPKSGFDSEVEMLPEESAIIQAPPDLLSLLLPLLAIVISLSFE